MKLLTLSLLFLPLVAQDAPKPAAKAPLTAEQRARFWRAQVEAIVATEQARKAEERLAALRREICGDGYEVVPDAGGEPSCQAKPQPK